MKLIKYIVYTACSAIALSSCSKQLDLVPTDTINENNAYRTIADAQLGANGAYARYNTYNSNIFLSALLSDEAKLGADNAGQGAITYRYQFTAESGDVNGGYAGYYLVIDQVNRVLSALPNVLAANSFEESRRNILKGQLLALRGISHFGLLESFCKNYDPAGKGVPIMTTVNPAIQPPHNTMGEVMARIETDLSDAATLLASAPFSDTVMNKINIDAYRARIALYKGDYTNAITYASNVIASGVKPIVTGSFYNSIWTESTYPTIPEVLFRIRNATGTALGAYWTTTGNIVYIAPSDKLTNIYGAGDIRKNAFIGTINSKPYVKKHESARPGLPGNRIVDLKTIRTSEMYLIRAEAYARQASPNLAAGTTDLNTLRAQRITGYVNVPTFANAADLITAVIEERYKELCFEGTRFFDLRRNGLPVARAASDVTSTVWQNLPAGDYRFVMPLPQAEILANPNAIQNPGY